MKKEICILSCVAMLAVGFAFYANNTSTVKSLTESTVEALSNDGDTYSGSPIVQYGEYPHRLIVNNMTNVVIMEGYKRVMENGEYQNECEEYDGHTCTLGTSTTLSDVTGYTAAVTSLLQAIPGLTTITSIVDWVISLFN